MSAFGIFFLLRSCLARGESGWISYSLYYHGSFENLYLRHGVSCGLCVSGWTCNLCIWGGRHGIENNRREVGTGIDFGNFPAARLDPSGPEISGIVYEIADAETLRRLDAYEEFDPKHPEGSLFRRERAIVGTETGPRNCWIYVYNREPGAAPRILSGQFQPRK